jgi:hypothetical protein
MPQRLMVGLICVARAHPADPLFQGRMTTQDGLWCFCPAANVTRPHARPWPGFSAGKNRIAPAMKPGNLVVSTARRRIYRSLTHMARGSA